MNTAQKSAKEQGFTIVELMIALTILSLILIVSTVALIQIGALYSKGVNAADLQNASRTITADISGQLQFSGNAPSGCTSNNPDTTCWSARTANVHNNADGTTQTVYSYCVGHTRYTYVLDRELGTDSSFSPAAQTTQHVLWRDTLKNNSGCSPLDIVNTAQPSDSLSNNDGYEMLGNHMRLTRFKIDQTSAGSGVYYADVWLTFGDRDLMQIQGNGSATCNGGAGTQFCSTSALTTKLTGRVY